MRRALVLAALLGPWAAGCQSGPPPSVGDLETLLADAERRLAAGDAASCRDLLLSRDEDEFARALRPRYEVALAAAHLELGDAWDTFEVLRDFADDHPHSELRDQAVRLQYRAGERLEQSDGGFLFFWSDRRRARAVLEHLITRYPDSNWLADALRLLGEMAFEDGDYERAEERFRELMRRRPESEWIALARFRFAMSIVGSLRGPEYDLERMQLATKELRVFLEDPPENPAFVDEAGQALQRLLSWQAARHVMIADFYRTVENRYGEVIHLQQATVPEFAGTPAADAARQRLAALEAADPANTPGPEARR